MVRGDPPHLLEAVYPELAPSCVVRLLQTQNFFRSKKVVLFAFLFFGGFPLTVLVVRLILWRRRCRFRRRLDLKLESIEIRRTDHPHHTQRKAKCQE